MPDCTALHAKKGSKGHPQAVRRTCVEHECQKEQADSTWLSPIGMCMEVTFKARPPSQVHEWLGWLGLRTICAVTNKCQQQVNWHIGNTPRSWWLTSLVSNALKENKPVVSTPLINPASY